MAGPIVSVSRFLLAMRFFGVLGMCMVSLAGCALLPSAPHTGGDHAFIVRWPATGHGLRLAIKDNIDMAGIVTTAGSGFLAREAPPAKKDAACLARVRRSGVQIVGKTNLSEFSGAPSGFNEYFGTPINPLSRGWKRIPGGSSSGSAVAVATGQADVAFGTDTAGSIRVPATCCGIVGLKTTRGLVALEGVYPIEPNLMDTVGPMARNIAGAVAGMDLLSEGFAARYAAACARAPQAANLRVGRLRLKGTDPAIDNAIDRALAMAGFQVIHLDDGFRDRWEQAKKDGNTVAAVGIWMYYERFRNDREVSLRTKGAMLLGRLEYGPTYFRALDRGFEWSRVLQQALARVDFIALPTMQTIPPRMGIGFEIGTIETRMLALQNTVPVNSAGNPALSVPVPLTGRDFPVTGLQLIGPKNSEAELLNSGRLIEAALNSAPRRNVGSLPEW